MGASAATIAAPPRIPANERDRLLTELRALALDLQRADRSVAELTQSLADAIEEHRPEDVRAYAAAIPPQAVAQALTLRHRSIWGIAEIVRGALVLVPIAFTWYGLAAASVAYASLLTVRPELVSQPFLLLWQRDFEGLGGVITFSGLAAIDGSVISAIIALSLVLQYKSEVRDPQLNAQMLLKESQVRRLLARAVSLASFTDTRPDARLPTAEVLSGTADLRESLAPLAGFAESTERFAEWTATAHQAVLKQLQSLSDREAALLEAVRALSAHPMPHITDAASAVESALQLGEDSERRIVAETQQLIASLDEARKAQQVAIGSVSLQTDAMSYMAKALLTASERVQVAAETLGERAVPRDLFANRRRRWPYAALGAALLGILIVAGIVLPPRLVPSAEALYLRDAQVQAAKLEGVRSLRVAIVSPRTAPGDQAIRTTATRVAAGASEVDTWLTTHQPPPDSRAVATALSSASVASARAAQEIAAWLAAHPDPLDRATVPPEVQLDLATADGLLRDAQLALAAGR